MLRINRFLLLIVTLGGQVVRCEEETGWQKTAQLAAPEAIQAAAADRQFIYAIASRSVAKYERASGQRVAVSKGAATHLNSGFLWQGKLLCAHSNYPKTPEQSQVKVLDPESMELSTFKDFGDFGGSLTWIVRHEQSWWCNFAKYGDQNDQTFLVKFDDQWTERGRWQYPAEVIRQLGRYSLSGGLWYGQELLVTGHDKPEVYRLRLSRCERDLVFLGKQAIPFTGQGIAADDRGLVGINRAKRLVIFAER